MFYAYTFFNNSVDIHKIQQINKKGEPYAYNNITFEICKLKRQRRGIILSDKCLSEEEYQQMNGLPIPSLSYTDFSFRKAFFIIE